MQTATFLPLRSPIFHQGGVKEVGEGKYKKNNNFSLLSILLSLFHPHPLAIRPFARTRVRGVKEKEVGNGSFPAAERQDRGGNRRQPSFCLFRAKTRPGGPRGGTGGQIGQPYACGGPDATGANVGNPGRKKAAAGRGDIQPPRKTCGNVPHGIAPRALSQARAAVSSEGDAREG